MLRALPSVRIAKRGERSRVEARADREMRPGCQRDSPGAFRQRCHLRATRAAWEELLAEPWQRGHEHRVWTLLPKRAQPLDLRRGDPGPLHDDAAVFQVVHRL